MAERFPYESLLERDALLVLDLDPSISALQAQPETFVWNVDGRERSYTPDLRVVRGDKTLYIQVKPAEKLAQDRDLGGRLPAIERQCAARGAQHVFWTDDDIRREPRLANSRRARAAVAFCTPENAAVAWQALASTGLPTTLGNFNARTGAQPVLLNTVLGLAARRKLVIDWASPITPDTLVNAGHL